LIYDSAMADGLRTSEMSIEFGEFLRLP
jgi:hypothetical protein